MTTFSEQFLADTIDILDRVDAAERRSRRARSCATHATAAAACSSAGPGGGAGHASHATCDFRKLGRLRGVLRHRQRLRADGPRSTTTAGTPRTPNWLRASRLPSPATACSCSRSAAEASSRRSAEPRRVHAAGQGGRCQRRRRRRARRRCASRQLADACIVMPDGRPDARHPADRGPAGADVAPDRVAPDAGRVDRQVGRPRGHRDRPPAERSRAARRTTSRSSPARAGASAPRSRAWLAEAGAAIVAVVPARRHEHRRRWPRELGGRYGTSRASRTRATSADADARRALVHGARRRFGRIDIAVANAAVLGPVGPIDRRSIRQRWARHAARSTSPERANLARARRARHARAAVRAASSRCPAAGVGGPRPAARVSARTSRRRRPSCALTEALALELPRRRHDQRGRARRRARPVHATRCSSAGRRSRATRCSTRQRRDADADLEPLRELAALSRRRQSSWLQRCCLSARWDPSQHACRARPTRSSRQSRYRLRRIDERPVRRATGDPSDDRRRHRRVRAHRPQAGCATLPRTTRWSRCFDVDAARAGRCSVAGPSTGAAATDSLDDARSRPTSTWSSWRRCTTRSARSPCAAVEAGKHVLVEKPGAHRRRRPAPRLRDAAAEPRRGACASATTTASIPALRKVRELRASRRRYGPAHVRARPLRPRRPARLRAGVARRPSPFAAAASSSTRASTSSTSTARCFGDVDLAFAELPTLFWAMAVEDNAFLALRPRAGGFAWLHASLDGVEEPVLVRGDARAGQGRGHRASAAATAPSGCTLYEMEPELGPPPSTRREWPPDDDSWRASSATSSARSTATARRRRHRSTTPSPRSRIIEEAYRA